MANLRSLRCLLQELAWANLRRIRRPPESVIRVQASDGQTVLCLTVAAHGSGDAPDQEQGADTVLPLSPSEQLILQAIGRAKLNAKAIAARTRQLDTNGQASYQVRVLLGNLCERKVLDEDEGYRLTDGGLCIAIRLGLVSENP